ncbi:MAG: serine/threonine-protein kinase, partial [Thiotrichaceae bacterium]|nr:serine/threonine-protein kinase [Thiotrichaceae bacterium]
MSTQAYQLPANYQLQEYQIQSVLGAGGFGVTYLAIDTHLDAKVAIKEFFPSELAVRESGFTVHTKLPKFKDDFQWGLQRFIQESKILAQLRHPNIVRVIRFLEANHTAYLVMEYEEGDSLSELIGSGEKATEEEILAILLPLLSGLQQMHQKGILHRDIKPANIYIRSDNSPVLLDFGSARYDVESRSRSVTSIVTPGYAPLTRDDAPRRHATGRISLHHSLTQCVSGSFYAVRRTRVI